MQFSNRYISLHLLCKNICELIIFCLAKTAGKQVSSKTSRGFRGSSKPLSRLNIFWTCGVDSAVRDKTCFWVLCGCLMLREKTSAGCHIYEQKWHLEGVFDHHPPPPLQKNKVATGVEHWLEIKYLSLAKRNKSQTNKINHGVRVSMFCLQPPTVAEGTGPVHSDRWKNIYVQMRVTLLQGQTGWVLIARVLLLMATTGCSRRSLQARQRWLEVNLTIKKKTRKTIWLYCERSCSEVDWTSHVYQVVNNSNCMEFISVKVFLHEVIWQ